MLYREFVNALETYYGVKLHKLTLEHEDSYYVRALKLREPESITEFLKRWRIRRRVDAQILEKLINHHNTALLTLNKENLLHAKLYRHRNTITKVYSDFSKHLGYTGASKALHVLAPNLLVMWDAAIRKNYGLAATPEAYYNFHLRMQNELEELNEETTPKTEIPVTKLLDAYNIIKTRR